jgi:hypothetical protein
MLAPCCFQQGLRRRTLFRIATLLSHLATIARVADSA